MGLGDIFKVEQYKKQLKESEELIDRLRFALDSVQEMLTPEMKDAENLKNMVSNLEMRKNTLLSQISDLEDISNLTNEKNIIENKLIQLNDELTNRTNKLNELDSSIHAKENDLIVLDEEVSIQEFGLYKPHYDFANALEYKEKLSEIRAKQKALIKDKRAVSGSAEWTVNGSKTQGKKMVSDTQKLLLRAFNIECDEVISKVKYTNFDSSLNRIYKSADAVSKLGTIMDISIQYSYLKLKEDELRLAFEYQQKKQEEKEAQKAARAELREAARLQKEIEAQRKKIEKEQTHYQTAYEHLLEQLKSSPDDSALLTKKEELENQLRDIDKAIEDIDYREANQRAGYVYVISNIGAFGPDIYKIGMTRRLNPQERVDELGDASVPFNFDVHAMIFSDDAPALENALHKAFEDRKLNMVNTRREFFNVTLDEIKEVVKNNFDKTVEFIDIPDAEQYRISQKMKHDNLT